METLHVCFKQEGTLSHEQPTNALLPSSLVVITSQAGFRSIGEIESLDGVKKRTRATGKCETLTCGALGLVHFYGLDAGPG